MHIYLSHPVHGRKVAISDMEADFDVRQGWSRYTPDAPAAVQDAEPVNSLVAAPQQRRRRTQN